MLGQMLELLQLAVKGHASSTASAMRAVLLAKGIDLEKVAHTASALTNVNRDYRRPAAHRTLLPCTQWLDCHRVMMLQADARLPGLTSLLL